MNSNRSLDVREALNRIEALLDLPREPNWSYRNTITTSKQLIRDEIANARAALAAQPVAEPSIPREWKLAVMLAYGHLWHVNNEPAAPVQMYPSEKAAYKARIQLRDLLTNEERGEAINQVGFLIGRYEAPPQNSEGHPQCIAPRCAWANGSCEGKTGPCYIRLSAPTPPEREAPAASEDAIRYSRDAEYEAASEPVLLQDEAGREAKRLSKALADTPGARRIVDENVAAPSAGLSDEAVFEAMAKCDPSWNAYGKSRHAAVVLALQCVKDIESRCRAPTIPKGMVLVPKFATPRILAIFRDCADGDAKYTMQEAWTAMLAAAKLYTPAGEKEGDRE